VPLALPNNNPNNIPDVIALMQNIDAALPAHDGVKSFNKLYLIVTQQVDSKPRAFWEAPDWLTQLDVIFAGLYFDALRTTINGGTPPQSWQALFESRFSGGIDRIQFALAGMNAHINHDLAWALLTVNQAMNLQPDMASPQRADFENVNNLLKAALPEALAFLDTGVLGDMADKAGLIGRLLALWDVAEARDLAWSFSAHLQAMPLAFRGAARDAQDQLTGVIGRALLLPIDSAAVA
jgi:hypothetical protein